MIPARGEARVRTVRNKYAVRVYNTYHVTQRTHNIPKPKTAQLEEVVVDLGNESKRTGTELDTPRIPLPGRDGAHYHLRSEECWEMPLIYGGIVMNEDDEGDNVDASRPLDHILCFSPSSCVRFHITHLPNANESTSPDLPAANDEQSTLATMRK